MKVENDILYINNRIDYEHCSELLTLSKDVETIVVQTNDVHPAIFQTLFVLTKEKKVIIEDEFNKRFFENLRLLDG